MITIDWMGINGFLIALSALIGVLVPSGLSIATYIRTSRIANHQTLIAANVQRIELATNSMKDALVVATRNQALMDGAVIGRAEERAEQALKAEGAFAALSPSAMPKNS